MFVGTGQLRKPAEYAEARRRRREDGEPIKRIARALGVSPGTVHAWTRDIELTPEQRERNRVGPRGPANPEAVAARAAAWSARNRERRRAYQAAGRLRARDRDPLHMAGCMLYWAEGAKSRNNATLGNSDVNVMRFYLRFLRECFAIDPDQLTLRLNVYTTNGLSLTEIETHWLEALELPRSCRRTHTINHTPTSSSGRKTNKLPYGVCTVRVKRSTWLVQHIFGAIQEYGGFDEPQWLDCERRNYGPPGARTQT